MRILLLCSAFNGLSQRVWTELRRDGHHVVVQTADSDDAVRAAVARARPELVLCPFLKERVPEDVWRRHPTVIIHPGPIGDRGPSSLDWAIAEGADRWGVTALSAIDEMDGGPVWGTRTFAVDTADPPRKSSLYGGAVTDAAAALAREVVEKAADPAFTPLPLADHAPGAARGRLRPLMTQVERAFSWEDPTADVLRRIRAADGFPGVRTTLAGLDVSVYDAHPDPHYGAAPRVRPGEISLCQNGAVLVHTGDGALWVGHVRVRGGGSTPSVKLPATTALGARVAHLPRRHEPFPGRPGQSSWSGYREIGYDRVGPVGVVSFDFHNGAMSTAQCERLTAALRYAAGQDTAVLLLQGGDSFSNGVHLNAIEASPRPGPEAWRNINAVDDACAAVLDCTRQLVVAAVGGNAGAGGVMFALGADIVLARESVVLNPHYKSMGLFGSEYWTYTLPRRVGSATATRLTEQCLPIGTAEAAEIGLVDEVLPGTRAEFEAAVLHRAVELACGADRVRLLADKVHRRESDERHRPLAAYRHHELAAMSLDIFENRNGFDELRHAFVTKQPSGRPAAAARAHLLPALVPA
ncbi:enoyl-CoA hydratase-related protein [Pseudonocardia humida]|uniref:enoyl-CoA hydratase-related protein n=1 Tax=Pseudonocardia humida TaxID=2800819 RepID=UPI00207CF315|nr:enoyl-CoA hydratase-related protein [Pseudonocardia humida]